MNSSPHPRAYAEAMNHPLPTHALTRLTLENFRNYRALTLEVGVRPVLLTGKNGAGKTNLLEAISLLMPGRGFRNASLRELDYSSPSASPPYSPPPAGGIRQREQAKEIQKTLPPPAGGVGGGNGAANFDVKRSSPWVIHAEILTQGITHQIGTGRATGEEGAREKRLLKINGEQVRQQSELTRHASIWWLTPAMDQLFNEGHSARRKFLDRLVYGFDPAHAARVSRYERAMRERNALLAEPVLTDSDWLAVLERQMAESAVAITTARQETIARICQTMEIMPGIFPYARMRLAPGAEGNIHKIAERLADFRGRDASAGRAITGVHRAELEVIHSIKNARAEQCSTGEQKALLLSILLAAARAKTAHSGQPPVLLFDEVVAHLDVDKRAALFDLISGAAIQVWMTGTDAADFQGLRDFATLLEIAEGRVVIRE
ncbi:MAG: DNA replication/repair protein RecF [Alphaproteobacteria bacterium]